MLRVRFNLLDSSHVQTNYGDDKLIEEVTTKLTEPNAFIKIPTTFDGSGRDVSDSDVWEDAETNDAPPYVIIPVRAIASVDVS